jgi:phosphoribosylanthranilate isomerase
VPADIKFCGLTRPEDAAMAAQLGARYAGVIFAGGPRQRPPAHARLVLDAAPGLQRVGVVAEHSVADLQALVDTVRLDVLQLHGAPTAARVDAVRDATGCVVWAVLRLGMAAISPADEALASTADVLLVEPTVMGQLGGTGQTFDWAAAAADLARLRRPGRLALAGGLTPINVKQALDILTPDVVDVSSGIERGPGVKDHLLMQAFAEAVAG